MITLVLYTSNKWKIDEIKETIYKEMKLSPRMIRCMTLHEFLKDTDTDIEIKPVSETDIDYDVNAMLKATSIASQLKYHTFPSDLGSIYYLAEDSGLEVEKLDHEPGVLSARYLGEKTPYPVKRKSILERMKGKDYRRAQIHSAMAVAHFTCNNIQCNVARDVGELLTVRHDDLYPESDHGYYSILDWTLTKNYIKNCNDLSAQQRAYINGRMDTTIETLDYILNRESLANHCDLFDDEINEQKGGN